MSSAPRAGAGTLDTFRTTMRGAFAGLARCVRGEPPLPRVAGT